MRLKDAVDRALGVILPKCYQDRLHSLREKGFFIPKTSLKFCSQQHWLLGCRKYHTPGKLRQYLQSSFSVRQRLGSVQNTGTSLSNSSALAHLSAIPY